LAIAERRIYSGCIACIAFRNITLALST
jgi:hypothetical protein